MDEGKSIFSVDGWKAYLKARKNRKVVLKILQLDWQNRYPRGPRIIDEQLIETFEKAFPVSKRTASKRSTSEFSEQKDKSRRKP